MQWTGEWSSTPRRRARPSRTWVADLLAWSAGVGLGVVLATAIASDTAHSLSAPGGWWTAVSRVTGFVAAYSLLIMVLLTCRFPWLERSVGQDTLVRWHRKVGGWPLVFAAVHIVTVTVGYAAPFGTGLPQQFWQFIRNYPDVLMSLVGFGLLVMAAVSSIRAARRRMSYETWWVIHLYMYLGVALTVAHQVTTGATFIGHPSSRLVWIGVWIGAALVIVLSRVIIPLYRNYRLQLRVESIHVEAPGVHSIVLRGKNLDTLAVSGGQFFQWRFLTRDLWWHAHPYSLSALPRPPFLRVTVKALGDHSRTLPSVRPGTRVFVEGPYGVFTHERVASTNVILVAAGVGITPLRALVEDLPSDIRLQVIVRASDPDTIVHGAEMHEWVAARGGVFETLVGPRDEVRLDEESLGRFINDPEDTDVFVCGPDEFTRSVVTALTVLGVPARCIHREEFAF